MAECVRKHVQLCVGFPTRFRDVLANFPLRDQIKTSAPPMIEIRKFVDLDAHGRQAEAVLGGATAPGGSAHRGAAEGLVYHDPDMVSSYLLDVEVSPALAFVLEKGTV